ncbi:MAG: TIR domain-containing protein [Opitutaceae bacterium]|jgi:class 3 adenylate cyclase
MPTPARPSIFVSYSHGYKSETEDSDHLQWVAKLVTALRAYGYPVDFDQDPPQKNRTVGEYSMRMCQTAERVIVVCTPSYKQKADDEKDKSTVRFEARYLIERLRKRGRDNGIVPIYRQLPIGQDGKANKTAAEPMFLADGKLYVDFSRDDTFQDKLTELIELLGDSSVTDNSLPNREYNHGVILMADIVNFSGQSNHAQRLIMRDLQSYFTEARQHDFKYLYVVGLLDSITVLWDSEQGGHDHALRLAVDLAAWLARKRPGLATRIGLHVGDSLQLQKESSAWRTSLFGTGCNDCRRLTQFGAEGHIMLSETFVQACQETSNRVARNLLQNQIYPPLKKPAFEIFPARGYSGYLRLYMQGSQTIPPRLLMLDHAAKRIASYQRRIGEVFQKLMVKKWQLDPSAADLRITLWAPDPALPETLHCTDYRWFLNKQTADDPSATTYSLIGQGEGGPGRAFRQASEKPFFIIPWLPDPKKNIVAYNTQMEKYYGLNSKTLKNASRHARAFACLPFWSPSGDAPNKPLGVLCFDSMKPFILRKDQAVEVAMLEADIRTFCTTKRGDFDDLAFAWMVRI